MRSALVATIYISVITPYPSSSLAPSTNDRYDQFMDDIRVLKDKASRTMGRSQWGQALELYARLAQLEPKEGTWPLRAGDAARRLGEQKKAIHWYEKAAKTYGDRGFVVRAIAELGGSWIHRSVIIVTVTVALCGSIRVVVTVVGSAQSRPGRMVTVIVLAVADLGSPREHCWIGVITVTSTLRGAI